MAKVELKTGVSDDQTEVWIQMDVEGEPAAHMNLAPHEAETLALNIAKTRAAIPDEVSRELDPGARLDALIDPIWRTVKHEHGVVLALRHPGLGWLSFLLPHESADKLAEWIAHRDQPQK